MKIRTGFVSNSSSSSFVIMGYEFKNFDDYGTLLKDEIYELMLKNESFQENMNDRAKCKDVDPVTFASVQDIKDLVEEIGLPNCTDKWLPDTFIDLWIDSDQEISRVGLELSKMGENETKAEFRKRTYTEILRFYDIKEEDVQFIDWCEVNY